MSLPTPPSTGHREKENRIPPFSTPRVIWSPHNQYRTINPTSHAPPTTGASKNRPTKSILKKPSQPLLPLIDAFTRETTPEPSQPQSDPQYLSSPVATVIDSSSSLDARIRAYSVLAARIKSHISLTSNASCLLLRPLRENAAAFAEAIVHDLGRSFTDPETMEQTAEDVEEEECLKEQLDMLPSPKNSPKKKKKGTTAKRAKYGRDLCTTCHSVIKLLGVVFTLPAVYSVFTVSELRLILTEVLAIPLADDLPTPNARKTYALSVWLLQSQRLPPVVLESAAPRIAFALRRGIEGELGKEGKKGSASDGLKAIHDLSVYQPSIFVPQFEALLPSVLTNLLAPTVAIRAQACHALGGFARGLSTLPVSSLHARISAIITCHLTTPSPSTKSPTKTSSNESALVRTLRTTLTATEAQHVSHGPVWGLSVLAALLVLVNSAVYADSLARRVFVALLSCAVNHLKSSVRALASAVWRCATWAYCQPLLPSPGDGESEVDEEVDSNAKLNKIEEGREIFWKKIVVTVVDMGVGTSTVAALLEEAESSTEENLDRVMTVLKAMIGKGGANVQTAIDILSRLVSLEPPETEWNWNKLLPRGLFSAWPGLLTADYAALETPVRAVVAQCPGVDDIRSLACCEVAQPAVFEKLVETWKECISCLGLRDDDPIPPNILMVWDHLIQINASALLDREASDNDPVDFVAQTVDILIDILLDSNIDVTLKHGGVCSADGPEPTNNFSNAALKIRLVRALWAIVRKVISASQLHGVGEKLVFCLMKGEDEFTDSGELSRTEWATFCAEALVICEPEDLQEFWNYDGAASSKWEWTPAIRSTVWRCFVEKWKEESDYAWQGVVILLTVPFSARKTWELSDADYELWEAFLGYGIDKALDYGLEAGAVLDFVASSIAKDYNPTTTGTSRIADALLSQLPVEDMRELPEAFFELINDTLRSSYPPEPRNKQQAIWTLRSVVRTVEQCPLELVLDLLQLLADGLCTWLSDAHQTLSESEYAYDTVNLYEVILMKIKYLPIKLKVLESVGRIIESVFVGRERENIPSAITDAFTDFWKETYAHFPVPKRGWPAEIQGCLGEQVVDPWDQLTLSPAFRGPQEVSASGKEVPVGSPYKLHDARFRSVSPEIEELSGAVSRKVESCRPVTPTTPVSMRSRASTPPRPHKLPSASQTSPASPASPLYAPYPPSSPATPKRTPLRLVSGSKPSPSKRRKLENKENESPRAFIMDAASPRVAQEVAVSKKHASPDRGEEERPYKRIRLDGALLGGEGSPIRTGAKAKDSRVAEEEERLVAFTLVVEREQSQAGAPKFLDEKMTPPSKKRKKFILDAVEVPSVREVYVGMSPKQKQEQVETRTRSTSMAAGRIPASRIQPISRKRSRDSDEDPFSDNTRGRSSKLAASSELSSDDDVYLGQVTPYHVVSPALRRARGDDPPSSDDSNMSASPVKGVVLRRLQKLGSHGRLPVAHQSS
ncbi:hypothetical protein GGX14DRAFT_474774 [Mycena pura]|uniref:Telomere-associated protein Rif1 N-terminal domain-containing protein n=1 Tax=Mycena pura TaxID=153505 RepID=A0AAD6UYW0_9AGAR|nr:hypothetical protein GGX14DRAFT_474774 [Mycena pura]